MSKLKFAGPAPRQKRLTRLQVLEAENAGLRDCGSRTESCSKLCQTPGGPRKIRRPKKKGGHTTTGSE
jgi:hypothetical protein